MSRADEIQQKYGLTKEEAEYIVILEKSLIEGHQAFVFWMREKQGTNPTGKVKFAINIEGDDLIRFMFLKCMLVDSGTMSLEKVYEHIFSLGIAAMEHGLRSTMVANMMQADIIKNLPQQQQDIIVGQAMKDAAKRMKERRDPSMAALLDEVTKLTDDQIEALTKGNPNADAPPLTDPDEDDEPDHGEDWKGGEKDE